MIILCISCVDFWFNCDDCSMGAHLN